MNITDVTAQAVKIERSGIGHVSIISGRSQDKFPMELYDCIYQIKKHTKLDISVNAGVMNKSCLIILKELNVKSIACVLSGISTTSSPEMPPGNNWQERLRMLQEAKELGLKTCANLVLGFSVSLQDTDTAICTAERLNISSLSLSHIWPTTLITETDRSQLNFMGRITAAARLCLPDEIDIAMSCYSTTDCIWGMRCGANAFTVPLMLKEKCGGNRDNGANWLKTFWDDYSKVSESYEPNRNVKNKTLKKTK